MTLNMLAVGIVVLNIAVALGIYFIDGGIDLPMMVGILYGAVTNTPGLGAAQEALNQLNYTGDPIALGYLALTLLVLSASSVPSLPSATSAG